MMFTSNNFRGYLLSHLLLLKTLFFKLLLICQTCRKVLYICIALSYNSASLTSDTIPGDSGSDNFEVYSHKKFFTHVFGFYSFESLISQAEFKIKKRYLYIFIRNSYCLLTNASMATPSPKPPQPSFSILPYL